MNFVHYLFQLEPCIKLFQLVHMDLMSEFLSQILWWADENTTSLSYEHLPCITREKRPNYNRIWLVTYYDHCKYIFFKASQYSSEERKDFSWSFPSWWLYVPNLHHNSKGKGEKSIKLHILSVHICFNIFKTRSYSHILSY